MKSCTRYYIDAKEKETMENLYQPKEIFQKYVAACEKKTSAKSARTILLGIMAGLFIALGAAGSSVSMYAIEPTGIARTVGGAVFPIGLMMILVIGGELFTGNCMLIGGVIDRRYSAGKMLKNLALVYVSNFLGAIFAALLVVNSGQLAFSDGALGANVIKTAVGKAGMEFVPAFISGILCNILVCAAVYMATGAKDMAGKLWAVFFPVFVFVICGFEHCVANMYYLSAGIFAAENATYAQKAMELFGYSQTQLDALNWGNALLHNLLPVTLGNMAGGMVIIGIPVTLLYKEKK